MPKFSLGDKLKIMFSPEKGKSIVDYLYKEVLIPAAKNTAYNMCQTAVAKFFDVDVKTLPQVDVTGRVAYSKVETTASKSPDKVSYLPSAQHAHNDLTWITFDSVKKANDLIDFMEEKINGHKKYCSVAEVYEFLGWKSEILQTDWDIGWRSASGIGILCRNNAYYVQAPFAKTLGNI